MEKENPAMNLEEKNKTTAHSLSIVMPVYNEEKNLEPTLKQTMDSLNRLGLIYEIIIVNDGSLDGTKTLVESLAKDIPKVTCVHHDVNQGIGAAFRTGVTKATKDYLLLVPADNPLMEEDLNAYLSKTGAYDIVAGAREERVGYPPGLRFLSCMYNRVLIPFLFGVTVKDVNWMQAYRRSIFADQGITIEYKGIFFFVEVLVKAHRKNCTITEVPVKTRKRIHGRPTISRVPIILGIFRDMLHFYFKRQEICREH